MKVKNLFNKYRYFKSPDFIAVLGENGRAVYCFSDNEYSRRPRPDNINQWFKVNRYMEVKKTDIPEKILEKLLLEL